MNNIRQKNYTSSNERMCTNRLVVERFKESDRSFFMTISGDAIVKKYFTSWRELEDCEEYFEDEILKTQDSGNLFLIIKKKDSTPIGLLNAFYICDGGWLVEYALLESFRRQGYMKELLKYIFENPFIFTSTFRTNKNSISYFEFEVKSDNVASEKLLRSIASELKLPIDFCHELIYIDFV